MLVAILLRLKQIFLFTGRHIYKFLLGILILSIVLTAAVIIINWNDQPPSPLALKFEASIKERPQVSNQENGFIFLLGMSAPQDLDPVTQGIIKKALVEKVAKGEAGNLEGDPSVTEFDYRKLRSASVTKLSDVCNLIVNPTCLNALTQGDKTIDEWLLQEQWLLNRYLILISYSKYQEQVVGDITMPIANYSAAMNGQKLFLMYLWRLAQTGESNKVLQLLEKDSSYWRMSSLSSSYLISKMVAVAALKRNFSFGNLLFKKIMKSNQAVSINSSLVPTSWNSPFSKEEINLAGALVGEWYLTDSLLRNTKNWVVYKAGYGYVKSGITNWSDLMSKCCLQPQASSNKHAEFFKYFIEKFDVSLQEYPASVKNLKTELNGKKIEIEVYNFVGDILIKIAEPIYIDYPGRVADLEGVRQATLVVAEMRNLHIPKEKCFEYLQQSVFRNPYTNQPFEWDAISGSVVFVGMQEGERGRYQFIL